MSEQMRLDRYLTLCGAGSRSESKKFIISGLVYVNGRVCRDPAAKVHSSTDEILLEDNVLLYEPFVYILMNKPTGVICATYDRYHATVLDLLQGEYAHRDLAPVGRLDIDTTGLLLLTDDGVLTHALLAPKRHVPKTYEATLAHSISEDDIQAFAQGITLSNFVAQSAQLRPLDGSDGTRVEVTLHEGKFHQVKRMFLARNNEVLTLKRTTFGALTLDEEALPAGQWRKLEAEEVERLRTAPV